MVSCTLKDLRLAEEAPVGIQFTTVTSHTSTNGGNHDKNTLVRQAVSIATRLSMKAMKVIGDAANMICTHMILSNSNLNSY